MLKLFRILFIILAIITAAAVGYAFWNFPSRGAGELKVFINSAIAVAYLFSAYAISNQLYHLFKGNIGLDFVMLLPLVVLTPINTLSEHKASAAAMILVLITYYTIMFILTPIWAKYNIKKAEKSNRASV